MEETTSSGRLDPAIFARALAYLRPYRAWVGFTLFLILAGSAVNQAGPFLTKIAVDDYIVPGDAAGLLDVVLLFSGLVVLQIFIGFGQTWCTRMIAQWAMRDVRLQIFEHLQRLPIRFFDRTPIGRLMTRNTNDVDALNELFADGIVSLVSDFFTIVAILSFIFYMDVPLGLLSSLSLPVAFLAIVWLQRKTYGYYREARTRFAAFAASLQESITGMEVIQLFRGEKRSERDFDEANESYSKARLQSTFYHSAYFPFMEFAGGILLALVLWLGMGRVLDARIEWGVLVAMLQYVPRFFMPLRDIAERYNTVQIAMASAERIFEILDCDPEPTGPSPGPTTRRGDIEFRNVWFAYDGEDWVLRDLSFRVQAGRSIALVGATGAGKSTVVSLLCRFYDIQRGQILVDGNDVKEWNVADLRRRIGMVQQEVFLFSGSVAENIALGAGELDSARIQESARHANADRFIERLPKKYNQPVGERGVSLSTGQRQLLSFARVMAAKPEILVLDEATANVDTETETWIQEAVGRLMSEQTSIVIAHRLSTIRNADAILVLHRGEVREAGGHQELLDKRGIYHRLHQLQYDDGGS